MLQECLNTGGFCSFLNNGGTSPMVFLYYLKNWGRCIGIHKPYAASPMLARACGLYTF